jgi:hypothetical protein
MLDSHKRLCSNKYFNKYVYSNLISMHIRVLIIFSTIKDTVKPETK